MAATGILISMAEPTVRMRQEAVMAGTFHSETAGKDLPKTQILSVTRSARARRAPAAPPLVASPYARAERAKPKADQPALFGD